MKLEDMPTAGSSRSTAQPRYGPSRFPRVVLDAELLGAVHREVGHHQHLLRRVRAGVPSRPGDRRPQRGGKWWGISEEILLAKLQRLGPAADLALEDAIARWHASRLEATLEGFGRAGLRIISPPPGHPGEHARDGED